MLCDNKNRIFLYSPLKKVIALVTVFVLTVYPIVEINISRSYELKYFKEWATEKVGRPIFPPPKSIQMTKECVGANL